MCHVADQDLSDQSVTASGKVEWVFPIAAGSFPFADTPSSDHAHPSTNRRRGSFRSVPARFRSLVPLIPVAAPLIPIARTRHSESCTPNSARWHLISDRSHGHFRCCIPDSDGWRGCFRTASPHALGLSEILCVRAADGDEARRAFEGQVNFTQRRLRSLVP